jgi:hypothetical protein
MSEFQMRTGRPIDGVPGAGQYAWAVFLPIVGVVLGIVAASRSQIGPAFALWATSGIAWAAWALLLTA